MALPQVWFEATDWLTRSSKTRSRCGGTHAKRFGTTLTACGLNAANFDKAWGRPFAASSVAAGDRGLIADGKVRMAGKQAIDITLTPVNARTFPLRCSHFLHSGMGMNGHITVQ